MIHTLKLTSEDAMALLAIVSVGMSTLMNDGNVDLSVEHKLAIDRFLAQLGGKPYWHEDNDFLRPKGE